MDQQTKFKSKYSKDTNMTAKTLVSNVFYYYMLLIANKTIDEQQPDISDENREEIIKKLKQRASSILTEKTISKIYKDIRKIDY